jgi:hypothetical protein
MYEADFPLTGRIRNAVQPDACSRSIYSTVVPSTPILQTKPQPEAETFMGTILKNGETFVPSDSVTKSRCTLDNPKKASLYEGKTVKVTGTLDMASNLIHVETIQDIVYANRWRVNRTLKS